MPSISEVINLQKQLNKLGASPPLKEDGDLGPKTWGSLMAQLNKDAGGVVVTPTDERIKGIDIYDGDEVQDWAKIAAGGIKFCYIKITQGIGNTQHNYKANRDGAKAHGILTGPYHFVDFRYDGPSQAAHFLSALNAVGGLGDDELPPWFDWEYNEKTTPEPKPSRDNPIAQAFLEKVKEKLKRKCTIYMSASLPDELGNPSWLLEYPLAVANYGVTHPRLRAPYTSWQFWQYSDSGAVNGINHNNPDTDSDYFNGTLDELKQFIASSKI